MPNLAPSLPQNLVPKAAALLETISPLVLADRLLTLAQDAERAGFRGAAERMLRVAFAVWDEKPLAP